MLIRRVALLSLSFGLVFALGAAGDAAAQDKSDKPAAKRGSAKKSSEVGDYAGVKAGVATIVPPGAKRRGKRGSKIFWVGFQPRSAGASRVFVQLGQEVEVEQWTEGKNLIIHLSRTRIGNRTVQRYLDTRFLDTSIRQIRARSVSRRRAKGERRAHDRGVQFTIDFKNPADLTQASATMATEEDGFSYLYLDFAKGSEAPEQEVDNRDFDVDDEAAQR